MSSVMPSKTYPKRFICGGITYTAHNAAEEASLLTNPSFAPGTVAETYPKILLLGNLEHQAHNAAEEASIRAYYGMS